MLVVGIAALVLVVAAALWLRFQAPPDPRGEPAGAPRSAPRGLRGPHRPAGREPRHPRHSPARRHRLVRRGPARRALPGAAARAPARRPAPRTASPPVGAAATASDRSPSRSPTRSASPGAASPAPVKPNSSCGRACTTSWRRSRSGAGSAPSTKRRAARAVVSDLGDEFVTLREYEVGDDLRRVHWRSTARTGELMIRQDEARWRSRAAVVLDVNPGAHDAASFEVAVEAAASVTRATGAVAAKGRGRHQRGRGAGHRRRSPSRRRSTCSPPSVPTTATNWRRCSSNLRAHRRVDLVVAVLGRVAPDTLRALGALGGIGVVVGAHPAGRVRAARVGGRGRRVDDAVRDRVERDVVAAPRGRSPAGSARDGPARPLPGAARAGGAECGGRAVARTRSSTRVASCSPCWAPRCSPTRSARWCGGAAGRCGSARASPRSALAVYVVLALEPSTTTIGLPGADTWHAIETQLSGGWHLLRTAPAPAPATDGAILLAVLAVW